MADCRSICWHCDEEFGSHAELEEHQQKQICPLQGYGCIEQTPFCKKNEHCSSEIHLQSLKFSLEYQIEHVKETKSNNLGQKEHQQWIQTLTSMAGVNSPSHGVTARQSSTHIEMNVADITTRLEAEHFDHSSRFDMGKEKTFVSIQQERVAQLKTSVFQRIDRLEQQVLEENEEEEHPSTINVGDQQWKEKCSQFELECFGYRQERESLVFLTNMLTVQMASTPLSTDGLLIWPIENLAAKIKDAISKKAIRIDSPVFSTSIDGHRLCAQLYLNGDENVTPKYISLYLMITTRHESNLCARIIYCLVDQSGALQHLVKTLDVNTNEVALPLGFADFILTCNVQMAESRFVRNDTLYLLIKTDQRRENQWNHHPFNVQHALRQIHP